MKVFVEVTAIPWRGNVGLFLWAPYLKKFEKQGFGRLEAGDMIIHYRTLRGEPYPGMFVGRSLVRGEPKVLDKSEFFQLLHRYGLAGSPYNKYFQRVLRHSKRVYYAKLSRFVEFEHKVPYSLLAEVSNTAWKKIRPRQGEYLKEIDKEIADVILNLAGYGKK